MGCAHAVCDNPGRRRGRGSGNESGRGGNAEDGDSGGADETSERGGDGKSVRCGDGQRVSDADDRGDNGPIPVQADEEVRKAKEKRHTLWTWLMLGGYTAWSW